MRRKNGSSTTASDILDLLDESVIVRGLDGRVLHWNAASERLYGWSRADAAGRVADDLLRTSGGPIANLQWLLDGGTPEANVARLTADGRQITVAIRWHLRRDARGRPADIVETGLARAAKTDAAILEGSEQRYRTLLHFVPFALVQFDRTELAGVFETLKSGGVRDLSHYVETHPDFVDYAMNSIKVIEVNGQTVQLFGARDAAQLLGPATRIWSEARETFRRSMQARFEGAARFEAEIRIRTFHDEVVDVLYVTDFPEALRHEALGLACLIDIRDRVKAQAMLARVQAEFAHAARVSMLGELTASIAHEVNQPLGAILTNGEAALRWFDRPEPDLDELRALSTRAVADARRAADVIDRIRAMAVRTEPTYAAVALRGVVEDVMMFLRPELRRQNVEAVLELAPDLPDVRRPCSVTAGPGQSRCQRRAGDGATGAIGAAAYHPHGAGRRAHRVRRGRRQRAWHRRRAYGPTVPELLHHQGRRHGHRTCDLPVDHRGARRIHPGLKSHRRARRPLPLHVAGLSGGHLSAFIHRYDTPR